MKRSSRFFDYYDKHFYDAISGLTLACDSNL